MLVRAHSSSGLGRVPLKDEITGPNPVCATKLLIIKYQITIIKNYLLLCLNTCFLYLLIRWYSVRSPEDSPNHVVLHSNTYLYSRAPTGKELTNIIAFYLLPIFNRRKSCFKSCIIYMEEKRLLQRVALELKICLGTRSANLPRPGHSMSTYFQRFLAEGDFGLRD